MSVLEKKRRKGKMEVQTKAIELAKYTMKKAGNESVIAKRNRWCIGDRMVNAVLDMCQCIDMANTLSLDNPPERKERLLNQKKALGCTFQLMTLLSIANDYKSIGKGYKSWTKLVATEQKLLNGWIDSDKSRVGD